MFRHDINPRPDFSFARRHVLNPKPSYSLARCHDINPRLFFALLAAMTFNYDLLFKQVHVPVAVELAEEGVCQVINKMNGFAGTLHLRAQSRIYIWEFVEGKDWNFNSVSLQLLIEFKVLELMRAQHDLRGDIEIRDLICFCDKRCST